MYQFKGYKNFVKVAEGRQVEICTALRVTDGSSVVLKALRSDAPPTDAIALMYHEYEVTKNLCMQGVIQVYTLLEERNNYAIVLEDMHGIFLRKYLQDNPIRDLSQFFIFAVQMARILETLHQHDIIHKDIKPSNFIIHPETHEIKLTDFNYSSKLLHEVQGIVAPSKLEGTLAYMAPEQTGRMNMNIDYRSDFYALGVTFYEMLSGELPFIFTDSLELLHAHLASPVPTVSNQQMDVPPVLSEIVKKLMAKNPSDRYQSMHGLQADLEQCQESLKNTGKIELFPLGQKDVFDRLNLSQKLYGREEESKKLLAAYERTSRGALEAVMVCGYSGIGKTMLVSEVHKPMVQHKGYFITGKFDQLARNTPYTAITQAFNQLARVILAESEQRFERIKKELIAALGGVAQVMIDLAPDIELIIGPQPALEKLPPQETQNRMMTFFKRFLHVVASQDHPLVLFIDDLQWIDSGSLKLLEYIMTDDELTHVLLIGAYRDNEVDEHHFLRQFFKEVQSKENNISFLPLAPLAQVHFQALFKDSFNRDDASVKPFSELVHKRTQGNPFFCKQVVNTTYREKLLFFDYKQRQWDWDLEGITALKITDNVVDLMLARLVELPEDTQKLLKYAACIGNLFQVEMLMLVSGKSASSIGKALWPALQQELIISHRLGYKRMDAMRQENLAAILSKDITYQFVHDKVQQAVYQGISQEDKPKIHLDIARLLLEKEPEACKKELLFEVTDHLNQAHELLGGDEKLKVIQFNYQAGVQAKNANAYQPMSNYLTAALQLLTEDDWKSHYDIMFAVNCEYALSLFLLNKVEEAQGLINDLHKKATLNLDKIRLYQLQVKIYHGQAQPIKLFEVMSAALSLCGITFAKNPNIVHVLLKYVEIQWRLRRFHVETLDKELPALSDPLILAAFEILIDSILTASWKSPIFGLYFNLFLFNLQLRFGKSKHAAILFSNYAHSLRIISKNVDRIFQYCTLAERASQENPDKHSDSAMFQSYVYVLSYLRFPFAVSEDYVLRAIQKGVESGNILMTINAKLMLSTVKALQAKSLEDIQVTRKTGLKAAIEAKSESMTLLTEMRILLDENLAQDRLEDGERFEFLKQNICKSSLKYIKLLLFRSLSVYYYFKGLFEKAVDYHKLWYSEKGLVQIDISRDQLVTINALALAQCIPQAPMLTKWRYQKRFRRILGELKWISEGSPVNFLHCYLCLKGVDARLKGNYLEALKHFNAAIEQAKKGDFYLFVAIHNELAGDMLMEQGQPRCALDYIREAHYYYGRYGMLLKVHALEKRYPECFMAGSEQMAATTESRGVSSSTTTSAGLDFMSVIKASQTISGEIVLERLFEKMLHIALENAGAEKAIFLEKQPKGDWMVAASLGKEFQMHGVPLKEYADIPSSAINLVIRSKESLVIADARKEGRLGEDPYVARVQPKSVLCVPIMHHDQMIGLLYLENNLSVGSFTQDRVTVLQTLASQIAISLENARHLEHTEALYKATERFVPKRFLQLLQKEHVEDVQLGDSVKRQISALFADIRGFTTLAESLTPERTALFLNTYMRYMAPLIRKNRGFVNQFLGDGIMALFPDSPSDAVDAAVAMNHTLAEFNKEIETKGFAPVSVGIGINTGYAMICALGEEERMDASVVSDAINTASRVEGLNKYYKTRLLISEAVYKQLSDPNKYLIRMVDRVVLKGKTVGMGIYEVWPLLDSAALKSEKEYIALFSKAFGFYERGEFKEAEEAFGVCLQQKPGDAVVEVLLGRTREFLKSGTPKGWDGTATLLEK